MEDRKFKLGDKLTYKFMKDLTHNYYHFGGVCKGGFVGKINRYRGYNIQNNCWNIDVTVNEPYALCYNMLESEFLEYDTPVVKDMFPIY